MILGIYQNLLKLLLYHFLSLYPSPPFHFSFYPFFTRPYGIFPRRQNIKYIPPPYLNPVVPVGGGGGIQRDRLLRHGQHNFIPSRPLTAVYLFNGFLRINFAINMMDLNRMRIQFIHDHHHQTQAHGDILYYHENFMITNKSDLKFFKIRLYIFLTDRILIHSTGFT